MLESHIVRQDERSFSQYVTFEEISSTLEILGWFPF